MATLIINLLILVGFVFLGFIFLKKKQETKLNWSIFYSSLWVSVILGIANYVCVNNGFWLYLENDSVIKIPLNLYFIWIVFWGILPFYFFKGKYTLLILLILFWMDILYMPYFEKIGILSLGHNWLIGELFLLIFVWLPSYYWASLFYNDKKHATRALFQVILMALLLTLIIPFFIGIHTSITKQFRYTSYLIQVGFIIAFPSLIAVQDLTSKGKGTPFPYDKTKNLVTTGVYAYIRNPIQWSFTLLFIPLSIYYQSYLLILGIIASILYTIGVSNPQEYEDMKIRFGSKWINYKKNVPNWYFLWKPKNIPKGKIYFQFQCNSCEDIKKWFVSRKAINLEITYDTQFTKHKIYQVTYLAYDGTEYTSVKAIANALEHINLAWACLAWFIKLPGIHFIIQSIVNSFEIEPATCKIK